MSGARVLIVEDEAIVALALRIKIESWGYKASSVESAGAAAIAAFDRSRPDIALLDIFLSDDVDGIAVARHIKDSARTPFIFLTASQDEQTQRRARDLEPVGMVPKPFDDSRLRAMLDLARSGIDSGSPYR